MAKITMTTPYAALEAKKNNPSKFIYQFSEFIDNSIASWENAKMETKLSINIFLNFRSREITIEDNAYGMSKEELEDSIKLNNEKTGNVLNMFGVGLKNAAFWLAPDLIIKTKQENNSAFVTEVLISEIEDKSLPVQWEVFETNKYKLGTTIYLKNVYKDRIIFPANFKELCTLLRNKYKLYLLENNIEIILHYLKDSIEEEVILEGFKDEAELIPEIKKEKFFQNLETHLVNLEVIEDLKERVIKLVNNDEELMFNYKTKIPELDNELFFTLGIQPQHRRWDNVGDNDKYDNKKFKAHYGLATFQHRRAINIPGLNVIDFGEYIRTNVKRVFGSIELGNIFKPDNNKQGFNMGEYEPAFKDLVKKIGSDMQKLADAVYYTLSDKILVKAGNNDSKQKKILNSLVSKTKDNIDWEIDEDGATQIYNLEGKQYKVNIIEKSTDDETSEYYFIYPQLVENEIINVTFNLNHPIWKPITSNDLIDIKIVLYPLLAMIGILLINANTNRTLSFLNEVGFEDSEDIVRYFNDLARNTIR